MLLKTIFDPILGKARKKDLATYAEIYAQNVTVTDTTTNEQTVLTKVIPANTFDIGDYFTFRLPTEGDNVSNTVRYKMNGTTFFQTTVNAYTSSLIQEGMLINDTNWTTITADISNPNVFQRFVADQKQDMTLTVTIAFAASTGGTKSRTMLSGRITHFRGK